MAPEPLGMFNMSVSQKPEEESRTRLEVVVKENGKTCHQSSCLKGIKGQTSAAPVASALSAASAATEMIRTYKQTQC